MPGKYDNIIGGAILVIVTLVWLGFLGALFIAVFGVFFGSGLLGLMVGAATVAVCACMSSNGPGPR